MDLENANSSDEASPKEKEKKHESLKEKLDRIMGKSTEKPASKSKSRAGTTSTGGGVLGEKIMEETESKEALRPVGGAEDV